MQRSTQKRLSIAVANGVMIWGVIVSIVFLFENSFITPAVIINPFDFLSFTMIAAVAAAIIIMFTMRDVITRPTKSTYFIVAGIALIIISNLLAIYLTPERLIFSIEVSSGGMQTIDVVVTDEYRARSIILSIIAGLFLIATLITLPRRKNSRYIIIIMAASYIFVCYGLVTYSLITEWSKYVETVTKGIDAYNHVPDGPFVNRNLFASYLLVGIIFALYLYSFHRRMRWIYFVLSIPLAIIIVFTVSKTKIMLVGLLYLSMFIFQQIRTFKKWWILYTIIDSVIVALITTFVLFRFVPALNETAVGAFTNKLLPARMLTGDSYDARKIIWNAALEFASSTKALIFGHGFYISKMLLGFAMAYEPETHFSYKFGNFHNGFLEAFSTGGLLMIIPYLAFIGYIIYIDIRILKRNVTFGFFSLVGIAIFIIHSMFESITLFLYNTEGIMHALPICLPQLAYHFRSNHPEYISDSETKNIGQIERKEKTA